MVGAPTRGAPGAVGSSLLFGGGALDRVVVAGGPVYDASAGWTIEAWVGLLGRGGGVQVMVKWDGSSIEDFQFQVNLDGTATSAAGAITGCDGVGCYGAVLPSWSPISDFAHMALSWDGALIHGYLNGLEVFLQAEPTAFFGTWSMPLSSR
jgi:hypothetical protein